MSECLLNIVSLYWNPTRTLGQLGNMAKKITCKFLYFDATLVFDLLNDRKQETVRSQSVKCGKLVPCSSRSCHRLHWQEKRILAEGNRSTLGALQGISPWTQIISQSLHLLKWQTFFHLYKYTSEWLSGRISASPGVTTAAARFGAQWQMEAENGKADGGADWQVFGCQSKVGHDSHTGNLPSSMTSEIWKEPCASFW